MKRTLIALGVIAATAAPLVAQAAPTLYGRLNLSVNNVDVDNVATGDVWNLTSHASRIGVKGDDKLTDSLSAVYGIEWQVEADSGTTDLTQRNRYVGVKAGWGTLKLGKLDTYLKTAEGRVDQFNDLAGDIDSTIGAQAGAARANNVIDYSSPKIADSLTLNLQLIQNEGAADGSPVVADRGNGLGDGISASAIFSAAELTAILAYNKDVVSRLGGGAADNLAADALRLSVSYNLKPVGLTLGALYQTAESDISAQDIEQDGFVLSAALKFADKWTAKAQFGQSTTEVNTVETDRSTTSLGLDYSLGKGARAYGYYTLNNTKAATDIDTNIFGVGLDYSF
ncbi:MAG: porin [Moraxellaceae bacterium]|nr:porin [Moraxellaceae bacterium]